MTNLLELKATAEQQEIIAAVAQRTGNVMVEAGAGCAKTSTMKMAAPGIKTPALSLAFNKRIAQDLEKVLPGNYTVKTLNGLGHSAWQRKLRNSKLVLDDRKLGKLVTSVAKDHKVALPGDQWTQVRELVENAMGLGLVPKVFNFPSLLPDTQEGWMEASPEGMLAGDFRQIWELAREVLVQNIKLAFQGTISFSDQTYCSVMLGGEFLQYPNVTVDENQDLSELNIAMLGKSLRPGGRIVAIGDKKQAIYGWRNAAGNAGQLIAELAPGWGHFPLLTTFRCPRAIVTRQQAHVPGFRAWEGAREGKVVVLPGGWTWPQLMANVPNPQAEIAILCRNNAPLVKFALKLISRGIGVSMLGRDIGKGLLALANKLFPLDSIPTSQVLGTIEDWRQQELAKFVDYPSKQDSISDKAECLLVLAEKAQDAGGLKVLILRIFSSENEQVLLSSIHRAKGMEWDCVVFLDPWRVPGKRILAANNPEALAQEYNLKYVAETRTRNVLVLASLNDFQET